MPNCGECNGRGFNVEYVTRYADIDGEWDEVLVMGEDGKPVTYVVECCECRGLGLDTNP